MTLLLTLLKYLGLLLSAASSIWGTLNDATYVTEGGRKRLTRGGKVALSFIGLGLLINVVASVVEDRLAERQAGARARLEQQRLREIIISGQPLHSLRLKWEFSGVNPAIEKELKEAGDWIAEMPETSEDLFKMLHGRERSQVFALLHRHKQLYPWMHSQVAGKWSGGDTVMLISLDESASALLVGGVLDAEPAPGTDESRLYYTKEKVREVSSGVDYDEALAAFYHMDPPPEGTRPYFSWESQPQLQMDSPHAVTIHWAIEAADLPSMVDLASARALPTAKMPETIRILILGDIEDLPADPGNFTRVAIPLPLRTEGASRPVQPVKPVTHESSRLWLEPNGVAEAGAVYEMIFLGVQDVANTNPELEKKYCQAALWEGRRVRAH